MGRESVRKEKVTKDRIKGEILEGFALKGVYFTLADSLILVGGNPPLVDRVMSLKRVSTGARTPPEVDCSKGKCTPPGLGYRVKLKG